jgi:thioredoxin 1
MIGDWVITIEKNLYSWANTHSENIWMWSVRVLIYIFGFLFFQLSNLYAQLRWPFSAVLRFGQSFFPVAHGRPLPVNEKKLQKLIEGNQPVLIDFWTEWCGPCIVMEGSLKKFAWEYRDQVVVAKVDATINPKLTKKHNVMGYPTLLLFFEGREIGRATGSRNYQSLVRFIDYYLEFD